MPAAIDIEDEPQKAEDFLGAAPKAEDFLGAAPTAGTDESFPTSEMAPLRGVAPLPAGDPNASALDMITGGIEKVQHGIGTGAAALANIPIEYINDVARAAGRESNLITPLQAGKTIGAPVTRENIAGQMLAPLGPVGSYLASKIPVPSLAKPVVEGLETAAAKTESGFKTPEGIVELPAMALKPVQALFAASMALSAPAQIKQTIQTLKSKDATAAQKWEALGDAGVHIAMTVAPVLHMTAEQVVTKYSPDEAQMAAAAAKVLPRTAIEAAKAEQPTTTEVSDASKVGKAAEVHGDVQSLPVQGEGGVPVEKGGGGILPQAVGGVPEEAGAPGPQPAPREVELTGQSGLATTPPPELTTQAKPFEKPPEMEGVRFDHAYDGAGGKKLWQFTVQDNGPAHNAAFSVPAGSTPEFIKAKIADLVALRGDTTLTPAVKSGDTVYEAKPGQKNHGTIKLSEAKKGNDILEGEHGFMFQGKFIDRAKAAEIFKSVTGNEPANPGELHSEDLDAAGLLTHLEEKPAPLTADEALAKEPGTVTHEQLVTMSDAEVNKLMTTVDADGVRKFRPHEQGVRFGMTQNADIVPKLQEMQKAEQKRGMEAGQKGDNEAFQGAYGKGTWLAGAIEGAKRQGPNYDLVLEQDALKGTPPKPVEPTTPVVDQPVNKPTGKRGGIPWKYHPSGQFDILDEIHELGGMRAPSKETLGAKKGDYDGYKEAMNIGAARQLRRAGTGQRPDELLQSLHAKGKFLRLQSVSDLFDAVSEAVQEREGQKGVKGGLSQAEAKQAKLEQAQHEDFRTGVVEGKDTANPPQLAGDVVKKPGDKFSFQGQEFTVESYDADADEYIVQDGMRFGRQYLKGEETIHPDPKAAGPKLRAGEKGTGELLQGEDQPFNLAGETGTDADRIAAQKAQAAKDAAEAKAKQDKEQQGFEGMGGAVPAEFERGPGTPTSIKNAVVDQERAQRGLPPMMQPLRRSFGEVWDKAMAHIDRDPAWLYGDKTRPGLIEELNRKARVLTDEETAALLYHHTDLRNEYAKASRDIAQHFQDGNEGMLQEAKIRQASYSDQLQELDNITKTSGTENARALNFRKAMAYEDFTLAKMELDKRAANGGRRLTEAESAEVARLHAKIAESQKAYDDYVAQSNARIADMEVKAALDRVKLEAAQKMDPVIKRIVTRVGEVLHTQRDAALARIKARGPRLMVGLDPTELADHAIVGASHLFDGALEFAEWSKKMLADFGETIKPHLDEIFAESNKRFDEAVDAASGKNKPRAAAAKKAVRDPAARAAGITDLISAKVKEGKRNEITMLVQRLARTFVERGVDDRDDLIDKVHSVLSQIDPTLTRREAMDAISGYGQFKQLSKDAISLELRDLKGQMQQVAKLEDIQQRQPPLKSGVERRTPSDEERRLIAQVEEAKRRFGITVTDPTTQLKSALDARKTYYRNQIKDLEDQISSKERFVKTRTPPPTDPELNALKAKRDVLKKDFEKILQEDEGYQSEIRNAELERQKSTLEKTIAEQERRLASGELVPAGRQVNRPADPLLEPLKQKRDSLSRQLSEARKKPADQKYAEALARQVEQLNKQVAEREAKLKSGDLSAQSTPKVNRPLPPELEQARQRLEAVNAQIAEARKSARPRLSPDEIALKALKTRLANSTKQLEDKIAAGDFTVKPKRELKLDAEALRLKAANERAKEEFRRNVMKDRLKQRTPYEKTMDAIVKWRRAFILSGPTTLAKLTSAAVQRISFTPIEEVVGAGYSTLFPAVARRASREGGISTLAEAKALTEGFTKGMRDAWDVLRTGRSQLDVLYGKDKGYPNEWVNLMGNIHGALKTVTKRNEFARSLQKQFESAMKTGVDVSDPMVQSRMALDAYKDANRSIFMQDNRVVSAYKRLLSAFDEPDKATGKVPLGRKALGATARVLLPIVKIPTNIVAETLQYATGTVTGSVRLARAYRAGIENLKPEEADLIMRQLKKGSLGAAVLLLGFFNPQAAGGYYQQGEKRKKSDVKYGSVRVFGHDIPSFLLHNPLLETLQIGATIRRVADSKLKKRDQDTQGIAAGTWAGALGLAEQVPFVRETTEVSKAFNPRERGQFTGELGRSLLVPQAVQWIAQHTDKDAQGNLVARKPRTAMQRIETGIPGLRQNVPRNPVQPQP